MKILKKTLHILKIKFEKSNEFFYESLNQPAEVHLLGKLEKK